MVCGSPCSTPAAGWGSCRQTPCHGSPSRIPPVPSAARISAFSQDGAWLASSNNGKIGLWNGRTGAFVGSAQVNDEVAVGFSEDSSTMVIASVDGDTVTTWDLRPETWVAAACEAAGRNLTKEEWQAALPNRSYQKVCPDAG